MLTFNHFTEWLMSISLDSWEKIVTIVAIIIGGGAAYWKYLWGRIRVLRLCPEISAKVVCVDGRSHLLVTSSLENVGTLRAKIHIHCRARMERMAAILIAYHAQKHSVCYDEALKTLQRARPILCPLPNQEFAIKRWLREKTANNLNWFGLIYFIVT